jgi:hypothetical protein
VAAFDDPIDVVPVRLRKGDRFSARLAGSVKTGFAVGLYNPSASDFELDATRQPHLVRSGTSRLSVKRITRSGIWFVAVAAPETPSTQVRYSLTVSARRP